MNADICSRTPRSVRRLLRSHVGETGVVVYGWFKRLIYWPTARDWVVVDVRVRKQHLAMLDEVRRGPVWLPLGPGAHTVEFSGLNGVLHVEMLDLAPGRQVFIAFRPARWLPFRTPHAARRRLVRP